MSIVIREDRECRQVGKGDEEAPVPERLSADNASDASVVPVKRASLSPVSSSPRAPNLHQRPLSCMSREFTLYIDRS